MSEPSDRDGGSEGAEDGTLSLRERLIGLGEHSHRKSYYPQLQLRVAELERFRVLLDQSQDGILLFGLPGGGLVDLNGAARRLFQLGEEGTPAASLHDLVPAAERPALRAWLDGAAAEPLTIAVHGRRLELVYRPATFREGAFAVLAARDVTARLRMEEALRRKEDELLQAQKMEAVGRLAGGIAHDFNNLLTVILGVGSSVLDALRDGDPLRGEVTEILDAAHQASQLTRQLLAFGRKQLLQPRTVGLNDVVRGTERMLRRIIGEHIAFETDLAPDAGGVFADPGQLEQVLVNLVVNARDAMPSGGRLRVSTRVVADREAGEPAVVELAVQDTGVGMDAITRARIFEPFFTTKELGRGTGLGLSTVYGIVRQSGGQVRVESEPGQGSTFRVWLPQTAAPALTEAAPPDRRLPASGRGRTVLVAEDDPAVLRFLCESLRAGGYAPLPAGSPQEAVRVAAASGAVDLLVTDVVMPAQSGLELADALARQEPGLRVLLISGYAEEPQAIARRLEQGWRLLPKPFGRAELLRAAAEALAAGGRA